MGPFKGLLKVGVIPVSTWHMMSVKRASTMLALYIKTCISGGMTLEV